jgi:hypothetical protein
MFFGKVYTTLYYLIPRLLYQLYARQLQTVGILETGTQGAIWMPFCVVQKRIIRPPRTKHGLLVAKRAVAAPVGPVAVETRLRCWIVCIVRVP